MSIRNTIRLVSEHIGTGRLPIVRPFGHRFLGEGGQRSETCVSVLQLPEQMYGIPTTSLFIHQVHYSGHFIHDRERNKELISRIARECLAREMDAVTAVATGEAERSFYQNLGLIVVLHRDGYHFMMMDLKRRSPL